ncbi:cation diffusion facilitator transporter [Rhizocola hellebori]|uniref:Cation diffusion facilitator transporter n=1 Tax=Rhizocola hellebori TaxID=1392758 RepID=A0A8J3VKE1_9ACTN|nr:cation diffusion facilitator transporter [Rhizocola hellebori]
MTTVIVAGGANLAIALAKVVAGVLSGSAAMLSEAAHSFADTTTEVLLYVALRRGARPADESHPFGHGRSAFVWALLAALFTFVAGGGFAVTHGVNTILNGEAPGNPTVSYIVLAIAFVLESVSLTQSVRQTRRAARRWRTPSLRFLRLTSDTTLKAIVLEDVAALIGLVIAGAGIGASHASGNSFWDGLASVLIGLLLLVVAVVLARANISLLIGQAMPLEARDGVLAILRATPHVNAVYELYTQQLGIGNVLVAARVGFVDTVTAGDVQRACELGEQSLRAAFPTIKQVFLDPTGASS